MSKAKLIRAVAIVNLLVLPSYGGALPDVSQAYPTNQWTTPSYPTPIGVGQTIDLGPFGFTNVTDASMFIGLSNRVDCEVCAIAGGSPFRVQASMGASFTEATAHMLHRFSVMSAKHPLPSLDPLVSNIGDLAYTGWNTNSIDSLFFIRNNVFVRVRSGNETQSVLPLSRLIDEQLLSLSTNAAPANASFSD